MSSGNIPSGDPRRYYQDFIDRYQQSPQGISEQEAAARYQQVAPQLPPGDYLQAAQEAFARMSPEERVQFGRYMAQEAQRQGHDFIDLNQDGIDDRLQDPEYLARTTTQVHQQQPGLLNQLFGGGGHAGGGTGGSLLRSPLAKGVLGGIAAYGLSRMLGGGHRGGLFGGHHHHRRHGHGGFEADDLFESSDFFGGDDD
ncbi:MAG TPA: hypothetical protein VFE09_07190 [Rubrobacteraceae bacterium]|nr:hypothetical protein [Rubrobacteraceae bacterium]